MHRGVLNRRYMLGGKRHRLKRQSNRHRVPNRWLRRYHIADRRLANDTAHMAFPRQPVPRGKTPQCDNAANHAAATVELVFTKGLGSPLAWIDLLSQNLRPDARTTEAQNTVAEKAKQSFFGGPAVMSSQRFNNEPQRRHLAIEPFEDYQDRSSLW